MARTNEEINTYNKKVRLEKKYIRVQELGISLLVSMPVAICLLVLFDLYIEMTVVMTIFIMATAGFLCLQLGEDKRNELWANSDDNSQGKGGESCQ